MPAQLIALSGGPSILLDKPILLIGRHPECDIQIDSRKISRRHCCIAQISDHLLVRDLGSTNGIRINGMRVVEGRLSHGDELTLGNHHYQVCWDSRASSAAVPGRGTFRGSDSRAEDELLESCDEPVPLEEPSAMDHSIAPVPSSSSDDIPANDSLILPENLELLPQSSDALPRVSDIPSPASSDGHREGE
jgi:pSer/pThr/pTyr-binding forkhead associated (FHA) protein